MTAKHLFAMKIKGGLLYVYIFTDHPQPGVIQERYLKEIER